jgi:hypothetical protein
MFGILVHWHDSKNLARVVVKVYLNDDAKILDFVKVNPSQPQKGSSWIVPYFALKKKSIPELSDEEAFVMHGPFTRS